MPAPGVHRRPSLRRRSLRLAVYESGLATLFTELTGGSRQIGFALLLEARDLQIGLLSALPSLANLAQLTASFLLERTGRRKLLAVFTAAASRLLWITIILLPLGVFRTLTDLRVWIMVVIVGLSALFAAMNSAVWLTWLGDLVPGRLRGRYFSRRNMVIAVVGTASSLLAAMLIDAWKGWFTPQDARGFLIVFAVGIAGGLAALGVQGLMPSLPLRPAPRTPFFSRLAIPLRDGNFRGFILYRVSWGFSVNLAGPFFAVYMLKELHLPYTMIAIFTALTAVGNVLGMRFWGQVTDRFSAKPVHMLGGVVTAALPGLWLTTAVLPAWTVLPLLHLLGGFGWAASTLNVNTLLLALTPHQERSIYLSVFGALTGLVAAGAPVVGGLVGKMVADEAVPLVPIAVSPYLVIFALSCLLRGLSLLLLRRVHEPREVPLERLVPIFGNLRALNTMMGFDTLFHYAHLQGERLDHFLISHRGMFRHTLERLDRVTDAYAAEAEEQVERLVHEGEEILASAQHQSDALEHRLDDYVVRSEARVARWLDPLAARLAVWWQRFSRWSSRDG